MHRVPLSVCNNRTYFLYGKGGERYISDEQTTVFSLVWRRVAIIVWVIAHDRILPLVQYSSCKHRRYVNKGIFTKTSDQTRNGGFQLNEVCSVHSYESIVTGSLHRVRLAATYPENDLIISNFFAPYFCILYIGDARLAALNFFLVPLHRPNSNHSHRHTS